MRKFGANVARKLLTIAVLCEGHPRHIKVSLKAYLENPTCGRLPFKGIVLGILHRDRCHLLYSLFSRKCTAVVILSVNLKCSRLPLIFQLNRLKVYHEVDRQLARKLSNWALTSFCFLIFYEAFE